MSCIKLYLIVRMNKMNEWMKIIHLHLELSWMLKAHLLFPICLRDVMLNYLSTKQLNVYIFLKTEHVEMYGFYKRSQKMPMIPVEWATAC
jgi:hypothetical protein